MQIEGGRDRRPDPSDEAPPVGDDRGVLRSGAALIADGRAFEAHEVFESAWRRARAEQRADADFWQGLVLVAGALHHADRGNERGRAALLERAEAKLESAVATGGPHAGRASAVVATLVEHGTSPSGRAALIEVLRSDRVAE